MAEDVVIPGRLPTSDYMVVAYRRGTTATASRLEGGWRHEWLAPGDVSLLTRSTSAHWTWSDPLDVVHVHLSRDELATTCRRMYEREVAEVALHDTIKADDPAVHRTVLAIADEAAQGGAGSGLLVEALTCQLSVAVLRRHASVVFREPAPPRSLTPRQEQAVREYVQENLHGRLTLAELAGAAGLSKYHFARGFRATTGRTPHEYVLAERTDRARTLLRRTSTPLLEVAHRCGFADQSHMNRVFRRRLGTTPGQVRRRP